MKTITYAFVALFTCSFAAIAQPVQNNAPAFGGFGWSTSNLWQALSLDSSGNLRVSGAGASSAAPYTYTKPTSPGDQLGLAVVTATSLTVPAGAKYATITVEGNAVRWRDDGTSPTASVGTLVQAGTSFTYSGPLSAIQFIQTAATATLDVNYYK